MKRIISLLVVSAIFLSGVILIPLVGLPSEGFRWQVYADAYQPMIIETNYDTGFPGSYFTVTGFNFPPSAAVDIIVNGVIVGTVNTDNMGGFVFVINSTGAEQGYYFVSTDETNSPSVRLWIHESLPLRLLSDDGEIFVLPPDVAVTLVSLPFLTK